LSLVVSVEVSMEEEVSMKEEWVVEEAEAAASPE
jgi:hypothetical protein